MARPDHERVLSAYGCAFFRNQLLGHNTADFVLEPEGSATRVTWVMYGPLNFIPGKLMSVFTTMDKMIGDDFQRGLANLKAAAEK